MWKLIEKVFHYIIRISTIKTVENFHSTFVLHIRNIQILSMLPRVYSCEESPETVSFCFLRIIWIIIDPMFYWEIFEKKLWRRQNFFWGGTELSIMIQKKFKKSKKRRKFSFFLIFSLKRRGHIILPIQSQLRGTSYISMKGDLWFTHEIASWSNDFTKLDNYFFVEFITSRAAFSQKLLPKLL